MAIIAQNKLFWWKEIEDLGDLERLNLVLNNLPDEELMRGVMWMLIGGRCTEG